MKIEILDSDFVRLQTIAEPLIDTPASVVTRLLDMFERVKVDHQPPATVKSDEKYTLETIPPLTHTKIMSGHFNNSKPSKQNWDSFVRQSLIEVLKYSESIEDLRRKSGANVKEGQFEDHGYKYVAENNFSFQGVSAEDAVKIIGRCARALDVSFEIEFIWRENPDAYRPGKRGLIKFP